MKSRSERILGKKVKVIPPPSIERTTGHCSICPSNEGVEVVKVMHDAAKPEFFAFCLRCCNLIGKAAK